MKNIPAQSVAHLLAVRKLFVEYVDALGIDLCFQGLRQELDGFSGASAKKGPPLPRNP
jgi:hypothetical protein